MPDDENIKWCVTGISLVVTAQTDKNCLRAVEQILKLSSRMTEKEVQRAVELYKEKRKGELL